MAKGYKPSVETKAKIRASLLGNKNALGRILSSETRAKIGAASKGRKHSAQTRAWMSTVRRGKKHAPPSAETRAKISASLSGDKNPRWRGDIQRPYALTFNAKLKDKVRCRDGRKCRLCGLSEAECEQKLDVHHVDYDKMNSDPVNLVSLCRPCHTRTCTNRGHWLALFREIILRDAISGLLIAE